MPGLLCGAFFEFRRRSALDGKDVDIHRQYGAERASFCVCSSDHGGIRQFDSGAEYIKAAIAWMKSSAVTLCREMNARRVEAPQHRAMVKRLAHIGD